MTYEQLTKKITDERGNESVDCRFHGTDMCQIHKPSGCNGCEVFRAILTQLNTFEEIYKEVAEDERRL